MGIPKLHGHALYLVADEGSRPQQKTTISAEAGGGDPTGMALEHPLAFAVVDVPQPHRVVVAPRQRPPPIGAEVAAGYRRLVPFEHLQALAGLYLPQRRRAV